MLFSWPWATQVMSGELGSGGAGGDAHGVCCGYLTKGQLQFIGKNVREVGVEVVLLDFVLIEVWQSQIGRDGQIKYAIVLLYCVVLAHLYFIFSSNSIDE